MSLSEELWTLKRLFKNCAQGALKFSKRGPDLSLLISGQKGDLKTEKETQRGPNSTKRFSGGPRSPKEDPVGQSAKARLQW